MIWRKFVLKNHVNPENPDTLSKQNNTMKHKLLLLLVPLLVSFILASCEKPYEYNVNDIPDFAGLEAPAADEGYQIHVPPFPVSPHFEREFFIRMPIGNTSDIYVNRFRSLCRLGTHHLIAYSYEDENDTDNPTIGVMRDQNMPDGRGNINLTMGSGAMYYLTQVPDFELNLPAGIAIKIPGNATVDLNSHYFNVSDQTQFGEVYLNMYTIPKDSATETLVVDDVDNDEVLFLPKGETTDIEYTDMIYERTEIRMMISHMHKRGVQFDVYMVGGPQDGELLYVSYDYQHAPTKFFDPPLVIESGQGLRTKVRYFNNSNRDIQFGVTSEDEMGILFYFRVEE